MVRFKNRYITAQIELPQGSYKKLIGFKDYDIYRTVLNAVELIHGQFGKASVLAGLKTKYCNEKTRIIIIRVRHGPHLLVASSLPFVTEIGKQECSLRILYVGATLIHCYRSIQNYQRLCLAKVWPEICKDPEGHEIEKQLMDIDFNFDGKKDAAAE